MLTCDMLPNYQPTVGAMCPHGLPDCLCDVVITQPVPIVTNLKHDWHALVLEAMDADTVSERNIYQFLCHVLGCFEQMRDMDEGVLRRCEVCNVHLPDRNKLRTTCSNQCRSRKRRFKKKGLINAV